MESFLILAGTATWFVAVFTFMVATMPVYMGAAFIMFLIGTVFVVGGVLLTAVNRVRSVLEDRLPTPPPPDADPGSREQITDWSAWRRDRGRQRASEDATHIG